MITFNISTIIAAAIRWGMAVVILPCAFAIKHNRRIFSHSVSR